MDIFLSWKCFPPQAIPLLPLFHEITFSFVCCNFMLLLPTSQSSCSESSASLQSAHWPTLHENKTLWCHIPVLLPALILLSALSPELRGQIILFIPFSSDDLFLLPCPYPLDTLLICCMNAFLFPHLHYLRKLIQDACKTLANCGNYISLSCIDFIWWDQDSGFHQHEDEDEIETLGDTKGIDIGNNIVLKGEAVTTAAKDLGYRQYLLTDAALEQLRSVRPGSTATMGCLIYSKDGARLAWMEKVLCPKLLYLIALLFAPLTK